MLDQIEKYDPTSLTTPTNTFIDSMCGDGQFLVGIKNRKIKNKISSNTAISTIYGIDLTQANVDSSIARVNGIDTQIVCADSLGTTFTMPIKPTKTVKIANPGIIEYEPA